jgi:hypothetical protein
MIARIIRFSLITISVLFALLMGFQILAFGSRPFVLVWSSEIFLILNAIYLIFMMRGPSFLEVDAAARFLHEAGSRHQWWKPYVKSYDEMATADPIAKSEFDGIVDGMLMAAGRARSAK